MFELPKSCLVNKFIPKKVFYEKVGISNSVKEDFVNQVDKITWLYKLSPDTIGISKTDEVEEIEIFQIDLKEKMIPKNVIKTITKGIPYKILFILKYNNDICYLVRLDELYYTDWNEPLVLSYNALNLETLFENIIKFIINENDNTRTFEEVINKKVKIDELNKEIEKYKIKVKNEKQFDKKVELNNKLNKLLKELEEYNNE